MNQVPQAQPRPMPPPQQTRPDKTLRIGLGCLAGCLVLVVAATVAGVFGWSSFVRWGIGTDLDDYHHMITQATTECTQREEMLSIVEDLQLRSEATGLDIGLVEWVDVDSAIRDMIEDGTIDPSECDPLMDELQAIADLN